MAKKDKATLADAITAALPVAVGIACNILRIEPDSLITYRDTPQGGIVVIVGQGQKFTFSAEDLDEPEATRAKMKKDKIKVLPSLTKPLPMQGDEDEG